MGRVGFFDDDALLSVVGAEEGGKLCTSVELYHGRGIFVLQQRAAVTPSQAEAFVVRMATWISNSKFGTALVLSVRYFNRFHRTALRIFHCALLLSL